MIVETTTVSTRTKQRKIVSVVATVLLLSGLIAGLVLTVKYRDSKFFCPSGCIEQSCTQNNNNGNSPTTYSCDCGTYCANKGTDTPLGAGIALLVISIIGSVVLGCCWMSW